MMTTVMNLPTDYVGVTEPTLSRGSPVVAKEAHTDGTRVVQYQSDDQNCMKTTIMQMPMDFLEITEPSLPRGFLELAEEARYVVVGSGQSCYAEEVQSQEAGLTRPVFVIIMECSSSVPKEGALIAPGIPTERIPPIFSAGRRYPVDQLGLVCPWDKTERRFCPDRITKMMAPIPRAQWAQTSLLTKFSQWLKARWASISHIAQWAQTESFPHVIQINRWMKAQWASMSHETLWVRTECFPCVIPISQCADGPEGPSGILSPVGPRRMFSQCKPDQPVAVGPVGQLFTPGPVGPCGMVSNHEPHDPIADSPVGLTETPDPVDETERPIQIDFMKIVPTDGPASLVDTPPSSDSGIHRRTMGKYEYKYGGYGSRRKCKAENL